MKHDRLVTFATLLILLAGAWVLFSLAGPIGWWHFIEIVIGVMLCQGAWAAIKQLLAD